MSQQQDVARKAVEDFLQEHAWDAVNESLAAQGAPPDVCTETIVQSLMRKAEQLYGWEKGE